jgi:dTDP-4-dehydrorhamnose reductase
LDLSSTQQLCERLDELQPEIILNAAAYTAVDLAETEQASNWALNHELPKTLAQWCASSGCVLVHFSTDYAYSGEGDLPWVETDPTEPINEYGRAKLAGDRAILAAGGKHLIFRTSWLYDVNGQNFVNTMLKLGFEKEHLEVVDDQVGSPTYVDDLASMTLLALDKGLGSDSFPSGLYHLVNQGWASWWAFADEIFRLARSKGLELKVKSVAKTATNNSQRPAPRPKNSRLNCQKFSDVFGLAMPAWRDGLSRCLEAKYESH